MHSNGQRGNRELGFCPFKESGLKLLTIPLGRKSFSPGNPPRNYRDDTFHLFIIVGYDRKPATWRFRLAGLMSVFSQIRQFVMHGMNRDERHAHVMRRAFDLARTGDYPDWSSIEIELCSRENFPEARQWLATRAVRNELDRACKSAGDRSSASRPNA
jgi:hypothetical protein